MDGLSYYQMLLVISILIMLFFLFIIANKRRKKQIHYAVLSISISMLVWNTSVLFYLTFPNINWLVILCEKLYFLGIIVTSIAILFTGMIFAKTKIRFTWKHALLFIVPIISVLTLLTNEYHHLFYTTFSLIPSNQVFGIYFTVHTIYSYLCIGVGLAYFGIFSINNFGIFSSQSRLIFFGILISLIVDSLSTFKVLNWSAAVENIALAVSTGCFILAMLRYDFLNVRPVAMHTVMDLITDGYAVINEDYEIIDYNKSFAQNYPGATNKALIYETMKNSDFDIDRQELIQQIDKAVNEQKKVSFNMQSSVEESVNYYLTEITPIFISGNHIGTIFLIKNITEHIKNMQQVLQLNAKLQSLATKDGLTQAYNRYYFDERLGQEIDKVNRLQAYGPNHAKEDHNIGLIMFDIDYFKIYNDNNGHLAGDELLQMIVMIVKKMISQTDILCRYGGEEFAVICCQTSAEGMKITAERIRKAVENYRFKFQDKLPNGKLTVSVGAAYCLGPNINKDDLIKSADNNLYFAKNSGRNKVVAS